MPVREFGAWLVGLGGLGVFWIVLLIATGRHPWSLIIGEDGRPSTSKFQMFIWTAAVVFAFLAIFELRFAAGYHDSPPGVPTNLLIAMGISVATAVSAKSIAVNAQTSVQPTPPAIAAIVQQVEPATPGENIAVEQMPAISRVAGGILTDDEGRPDIGKVQLVVWTVIAVCIFLSEVFAVISSATASSAHSPESLTLPDIGRTLMILMGLGHGAYIGKKIAET